MSGKRQRTAAAALHSERRGRGGSPTWALDVHLSAPGAGEGDSSHLIEKAEPFAIRGMLWPTSDGEPVEVDVLIEELRAQVLVSADDLPRLRRDLDAARGGRSRRRDRPEVGKTEALKPERVQRRPRNARSPRSRDE